MGLCDSKDCENESSIVSRLSPNGFLVSSGRKAYSFREAYERFNYCKECHDRLMIEVWSRVRSSEDKDEDHAAPTAV